MKSHKNFLLGRKCSLVGCPIFLILIFNTFIIISQGEVLSFESFDELKEMWEGDINENTECSSHASYFDPFLSPLDDGTVQICVWNEENLESSLSTKRYKFSDLKTKYCEVTWASIQVKYYIENAMAYTYPCTHSDTGQGSYCYLQNVEYGEDQPKWLIQTFDIDLETESFIEIKFALIPGGRMLFDQIIIEHDGRDPAGGSCTTTTASTEESTTAETQRTTIPSTTTEGTSETTDSEVTDGTTWFPRPSTTPSTTTTTQSTTTTSTTPDPDSCNEDCEYIGLDCHNYYSCINYTRKEYHECPKENGLAFNPSLKVCDRIENVEGCRETTTPPPEEECGCEYKPHERVCSKYYFCADSCRHETCEIRTCPGDLLWSIDFYGDGTFHQQCNLPEYASCASNDSGIARLEFTCIKKKDGLYRNEYDCHSYWKCRGGIALLYACPNGFVYNPELLSCDFPGRSLKYCDN